MTHIYNAFRGDSLDVFYEQYRRASRGDRGTNLDFPEHEIQRITNSISGEETAERAIGVFEAVMGAYQSVKAISPGRKVLDYGCGWGRITRLLPYYFADENIFGVDVNRDLIDSARQTLPSLSFECIESMGRLPYSSSTFDLIFANSVFSHLSEISATATIAELCRVLAPDGVLLLSVLQHKHLTQFYESNPLWGPKIIGELSDAETMLEENHFVWGDTKRWDNYGLTFISDDWLEPVMVKPGIVIKGKVEGSQNWVVCVKRKTLYQYIRSTTVYHYILSTTVYQYIRSTTVYQYIRSTIASLRSLIP